MDFDHERYYRPHMTDFDLLHEEVINIKILLVKSWMKRDKELRYMYGLLALVALYFFLKGGHEGDQTYFAFFGFLTMWSIAMFGGHLKSAGNRHWIEKYEEKIEDLEKRCKERAKSNET